MERRARRSTPATEVTLVGLPSMEDPCWEMGLSVVEEIHEWLHWLAAREAKGYARDQQR